MAVFQVIFLKQPDFGAAISLGIITLAMLFFSGMKLRYLLSMGSICAPRSSKAYKRAIQMEACYVFP